MKRVYCIAIYIVLIFSFKNELFAQETEKIIVILSKSLNVDKTEIELKEYELIDVPENVSGVYGFYQNKEQQGFLIDAKGKGRIDEFGFFILIDMDKLISMVRITKYVSDYGSEISSKKWLEQFVGFHGGNLNYGEDIQAISGATISAKSIVFESSEIINWFNDLAL